MKCWFVGLTSLTTLRELNHIIITLHHMFTPVEWSSLVNVGSRVLQSGIRAWFNTCTQWEVCVCHAFM